MRRLASEQSSPAGPTRTGHRVIGDRDGCGAARRALHTFCVLLTPFHPAFWCRVITVPVFQMRQRRPRERNRAGVAQLQRAGPSAQRLAVADSSLQTPPFPFPWHLHMASTAAMQTWRASHGTALGWGDAVRERLCRW